MNLAGTPPHSLAVADDRILQDQGTGGYDGTMTDDSVVQNGGAHTDEGAAFHFANRAA